MKGFIAHLLTIVTFIGVLATGILLALATSSAILAVNPKSPVLEGLGALFLFGFSTLGGFLAIWGAGKTYDLLMGNPRGEAKVKSRLFF